MPTALIADVALRVHLGRTRSAIFSYRVPERLRERIQAGSLVWAPWRRTRVQGVVLRLGMQTQSDLSLRELDDQADPEAIVTPIGLAFAEWIAETYHAPLYEALALLLPPGVGQDLESTWRATPAGLVADLGSLPERERAVLYLLRLRGEQGERALRAALRGSDSELRASYAALSERGLITQGYHQTSSAVRPRMIRVAQLAVAAEALVATLEGLARAPKQQAVLRWLADQGMDAHETVDLTAIYAATGANATTLRTLAQRGLVTLSEREVRRDPLAGKPEPADQPPPLTAGQRQAYAAIVTALEAGGDPAAHPQTEPTIFLLHGITGSGKTEIYLRTIARALRLGQQALVLVPEIALTAQLVRRFAARFPGQLAVLHSGLSLGERYDEWRRLRRGEAKLAIGSRSAVFAPLPKLGLIIVDEEHELSYKHDAAPRYHARDSAVQLGRLAGATVILGSATPSVESYAHAQTGRYQLLRLPERVGGGTGVDGLPRSEPLPLPPVRLVDMRLELQAGHRSIFSRPLLHALETTLNRGEQSILFLNRRGSAAFVMCRDCGHVITCGNCSNPMTVHEDQGADAPPTRDPRDATEAHAVKLICHACGARGSMPVICPSCLSPRIKRFGVGTQRIAAEVAASFPEARILRWDRDTVTAKGAHSRMLDALLRHEVDVLVGTQMIAKGLDLPMVALVGVVAADMGLQLPDFRSGERAFQLLTQVAGRAGRRTAGAQVIIQSYNPEHYALQAAQEHNYQRFFREEIAFRQVAAYPPFSRLVRLVYQAESQPSAQQAAEQLATRILLLLQRTQRQDWSLIGPAPAFMQRIRGRWRWHLILRAPADAPPTALSQVLDELGPTPGWMVDVDPVHVL